jgi:hypothetical protein
MLANSWSLDLDTKAATIDITIQVLEFRLIISRVGMASRRGLEDLGHQGTIRSFSVMNPNTKIGKVCWCKNLFFDAILNYRNSNCPGRVRFLYLVKSTLKRNIYFNFNYTFIYMYVYFTLKWPWCSSCSYPSKLSGDNEDRRCF